MYLLTITKAKSINGRASNMMVVENFVSAIIDSVQIRNPYTDFPADPVIIFCGGNAKKRKMSKLPARRALMVEEKTEWYLTAIRNIRENIVKELASIIPGDPAVHLTAFIQMINQKNRNISPGRLIDC